MNWKEVNLTDICDFQGGSQPPKSEWDTEALKGYVRMLQIRDFTQSKEEYIAFVKDSTKLKKCKSDDILIGRYGASVGKILTGLSGAYNVALIKTEPNEKLITKKFLYYLLIGGGFQNFILNIGNRAAQAGFNKNDLTDFKFFLPELQTQQQIVSILDKTQGLINKREQSLSLLDELLRATFLDMFGDPVINEKKWEIRKLGKISKLARGKFSPRPRNDPSYFNGNFPFIQTGDISKSNNRLNSYSQTLNEKGIKVSKEFKKDTIVIAIVGATIGTTAILEIDVYATDSIIGITAKSDQIHPCFLEYVLRFWKPILLATAPSAARANINLSILNKQDIITPSISEQHKFVTFFNKIEVQKKLIQNSLKEANNLFQSLLQDAFIGKLKLKDDQLELQSALNKVHWFDEQLKEFKPSQSIIEAQERLNAIANPKSPFSSFVKVQEMLRRASLPLERIAKLQEKLQKLNTPHLKHLKSFEAYNALRQDELIKQITGSTSFHINSYEQFVKAEKERELEEQLKQDNDPVLRFIGEEQIGNFTVANYKVNVARAIYELFDKREFDLEMLKEGLLDNYAVTVRITDLKKDVFRLFEEYIFSKMRNRFAFNDMRVQMKQDMFNPSFELLQEFIEQGLEKRTIKQVYSIDARDVPDNEWHPSNVLDTSTPSERSNRENNNRIYLHLKNQAYED